MQLLPDVLTYDLEKSVSRASLQETECYLTVKTEAWDKVMKKMHINLTNACWMDNTKQRKFRFIMCSLRRNHVSIDVVNKIRTSAQCSASLKKADRIWGSIGLRKVLKALNHCLNQYSLTFQAVFSTKFPITKIHEKQTESFHRHI